MKKIKKTNILQSINLIFEYIIFFIISTSFIYIVSDKLLVHWPRGPGSGLINYESLIKTSYNININYYKILENEGIDSDKGFINEKIGKIDGNGDLWCNQDHDECKDNEIKIGRLEKIKDMMETIPDKISALMERKEIPKFFLRRWIHNHVFEATFVKFLELYKNIYEKYGSFLLYSIITPTIFNTLFWVYCSALAYVDLNQSPAFLYKFKINRQPILINLDRKRYIKKYYSGMKKALMNQITINYLLSMLMWKWMNEAGSIKYVMEPEYMPSLIKIVLSIAFFAVIEEILFYYVHRLFHYGKFYKYIHKVHHEWVATVGFAAVYAHPVEHLLANFAPILAGPTLLKSHMVTQWCWFLLATINSINSHSGFYFPGMPDPLPHDYHHYSSKDCYGVLGILDRYHKTDQSFKKWIKKNSDKAESPWRKMGVSIPTWLENLLNIETLFFYYYTMYCYCITFILKLKLYRYMYYYFKSSELYISNKKVNKKHVVIHNKTQKKTL